MDIPVTPPENRCVVQNVQKQGSHKVEAPYNMPGKSKPETEELKVSATCIQIFIILQKLLSSLILSFSGNMHQNKTLFENVNGGFRVKFCVVYASFSPK